MRPLKKSQFSATRRDDTNTPNHSEYKIRAGLDKDGKPYIDLSDRPTAAHFMAQAGKFKKIRLG